MASVISTETIVWGTGLSPTAQDITVPADATAVFMFWAYNVSSGPSDGLSSCTLEGVAADEIFNKPGTSDAQMAGVAAWYNPTTGSARTLAPTWTLSVGNAGRSCIVCYVKDGDYSTGWRDAVGDTDVGTTAVTVSLTTNSSDLVLKYDSRYSAGLTYPSTSSGWTSVATHGNNNEASRLSSCNSPGASTTTIDSEDEFYSVVVGISIPTASGPYSATGSTGTQNFEGFQASQIGLHRNVTPGKAEFNAVGFAPSTSAGRQIDAAVGYANAVGFGAQAIYDSIGISGRINFNTGTHHTHVTREFFGLLGQLRALGFLVDQTNSQGFFPNIGSIVFQGQTGATVTVFTAPTTFTAAALLRETHFVGFQAQTIRDFFPISASTHAIGFTPQYVEFIKEITGPTTGEVNFSGFQAQAIILGQINDAIGQKGEINLVGFQHAVDMWRTLDILQGSINMQGFAAGIALFQGGTINLSGITGEVNFDTLQQAIGMYRTFYPDSGLTNAEGYVPVPSTGTLVQSIVGVLNQEGFIPFIVAERYRGIVGEMRLEGFAPTIGGGLWTPKRRRATSWAAIN